MPFQPYDRRAIHDATPLMGGIFPQGARVSLPPMIGGFVGSDALACLAYFHFDNPPGPIAAIDLGTNGEVMVTDGKRILTASTAAGPAFEGVNISCGSRAVDGAITGVRLEDGELVYDTIAGEPPVGLTGSGLLSLVHVLRQAGVIEPSGRIVDPPPHAERASCNKATTGAAFLLKPDGRLALSQWDIRELQKAKGAIRAAIEILMAQLGLKAGDLQRVILTGSFGGQVDIGSAIDLGMIPPVQPAVVETIANGAGFGAAMFLSDDGFAFAEELAARSEQIDLDQDADFYTHYVNAMALVPEMKQGEELQSSLGSFSWKGFLKTTRLTETIQEAIAQERRQREAQAREDIFHLILQGERQKAIESLLFFTLPKKFPVAVDKLIQQIEAGFGEGNQAMREEYLAFLVELALALRSLLPRWNLQNAERHGKSILTQARLEATADHLQAFIQRLARHAPEAEAAILGKIQVETAARYKAEQAPDPEQAAETLTGSSLGEFIENYCRELSQSQLRRIAEMRFSGETDTELSNDYAAFLQHTLYLGASFATTNPPLVNMAWDILPGTWNPIIDGHHQQPPRS